MMQKKVFFPNLDGLRFLCFLSVFFYHSFATDIAYIPNTSFYKAVKFGLFGNGFLGVNFFFVLSGFLITYLLLKEKNLYGKIHVGSFYVRRILRIWPLFYICVAFGFLIFPILKSYFGDTPNETAHTLAYVFLVNNFDYIAHKSDSSNLSVLWSVAIEEQFYLVWPLIVALVPVKHLTKIFFLIIAVSLVFRIIHSDNKELLTFHTLSCISDMTVGGFAAYLAFKGNVPKFGKWFTIVMYVVIGAVFFFQQYLFPAWLSRLIISVLFAFVIVEQCYSKNSFYKMGNFKILSVMGKYTYGLYCLHMIGILIGHTFLSKYGLNNTPYKLIFIEGAVTLLITLVLAYVSYHVMEKRFLELKSRFAFIKTKPIKADAVERAI